MGNKNAGLGSNLPAVAYGTNTNGAYLLPGNTLTEYTTTASIAKSARIGPPSTSTSDGSHVLKVGGDSILYLFPIGTGTGDGGLVVWRWVPVVPKDNPAAFVSQTGPDTARSTAGGKRDRYNRVPWFPIPLIHITYTLGSEVFPTAVARNDADQTRDDGLESVLDENTKFAVSTTLVADYSLGDYEPFIDSASHIAGIKLDLAPSIYLEVVTSRNGNLTKAGALAVTG